MRFSRDHDVMQRVFITIVIYLLLAFSFYLFFAGHHRPGGGFIGGLLGASSLILLYMIFGIDKARAIIRLSYPGLIAVGLLICIGTGALSLLASDAYLTQYFEYFTLPFFGEVELTTALPFDLGIYLVVIGMTMAVTTTIGEDE